jgi:hypothetical protein
MGSEISVKCPCHNDMVEHNLSSDMKSILGDKNEKNEIRQKIIPLLENNNYDEINNSFPKLQLEDHIFKNPVLKKMIFSFLINTFTTIIENTNNKCNILIKGGSSMAISLISNNKINKKFIEILDSYFWGDLDISIFINKKINKDEKKNIITVIDNILKYEITHFQASFQRNSNITRLLNQHMEITYSNKNRSYTQKGIFKERDLPFDTFLKLKTSIIEEEKEEEEKEEKEEEEKERINIYLYQLSLLHTKNSKTQMLNLIDITIHNKENLVLKNITELYDKSKEMDINPIKKYIQNKWDKVKNIKQMKMTHTFDYDPCQDYSLPESQKKPNVTPFN